MKPLGKATEMQLRDFGAAGQIASARIVRTDEGFYLTVAVRWKEHDVLAYTTRHKPRTWASVDRVVATLTSVAPALQTAELVLSAPKEWTTWLDELAAD